MKEPPLQASYEKRGSVVRGLLKREGFVQTQVWSWNVFPQGKDYHCAAARRLGTIAMSDIFYCSREGQKAEDSPLRGAPPYSSGLADRHDRRKQKCNEEQQSFGAEGLPCAV
jgi:hypothetical protein